jgi:uncharacterized protein (DUF1697 family)
VAEQTIALLRSINVGGTNKLPMADLRRLCCDLGFARVRTYIASGNVLFQTDLALGESAERLRSGIAERFGLTVPVVVRRVADLVAARARSPYADVGEPKFVHIVFLSGHPSDEAVAGIDLDRSPPTEFVVRGAEAHVHYVGGSARSKVTLRWLERQLGQTATGRNLPTVDKLIGLASPRKAPTHSR